MAQSSAKLGYGKNENIDKAIANHVIDENDIVITEDTSELVYIKDDRTKQYIRPRNKTFESIVDAVENLNASADTYAGQTVMIKNTDGKYNIYTVQVAPDGAWEVDPLPTATGTGLTWVRF